MAIFSLAGWFGGNRMLAHHVGDALTGCSWVGVAFAGGMSELPEIGARTIVVNDKHRHIINLARVAADDEMRPAMIRRLRRATFHPDQLAASQEICAAADAPSPPARPDPLLAQHYFVCCWMGRASKAGIDDEFNGRPSIRWKADGGDSRVRYDSAVRMLGTFSRTLRRCTFETMDALTEFLPRCEDLAGHGIYCDPPFPKVGRRYRHNAGQTDAEEREWHTRLRDQLERFEKARVVCRFYDHPLIRELYPPASWEWRYLTGRKQSNEDAAEVLIVRNAAQAGLFAG